MTYLEITKLCAEAMGLRVRLWGEGLPHACLILEGAGSYNPTYSPLDNDAQAMALVKKLHIQLHKTLRTPVDPFGQWIASRTDKYVSDPTHDLNRAICECAAKIQAGK